LEVFAFVRERVVLGTTSTRTNGSRTRSAINDSGEQKRTLHSS